MGNATNLTVQEVMSLGGEHTLLGMGMAFVVLTIIILVISLLKYLPGLLGAKQAKKEEAAAPAVQPAPVPAAPVEEEAVPEEDLTDDQELAAVISSAIAAYEGKNGLPNGFYVRSIRKVHANRWKNA